LLWEHPLYGNVSTDGPFKRQRSPGHVKPIGDKDNWTLHILSREPACCFKSIFYGCAGIGGQNDAAVRQCSLQCDGEAKLSGETFWPNASPAVHTGDDECADIFSLHQEKPKFNAIELAGEYDRDWRTRRRYARGRRAIEKVDPERDNEDGEDCKGYRDHPHDVGSANILVRQWTRGTDFCSTGNAIARANCNSCRTLS